MEKKNKKETIFYRAKSIGKYTETKFFTWGEVKEMLEKESITLQDTDKLYIQYKDEEQSHEDAYSEACYEVKVVREREETDEEFEERKAWSEELRKKSLAKKEESDRKEYERLKLKYENS